MNSDGARPSSSGRERIIQAYRFALDPSPAQGRALVSHAGAARFAWNWGLARCHERYAAEAKWYSAAELHKMWNPVKKGDPGRAWWNEKSRCGCQETSRALDGALREFVNSRDGQRRGRRIGVPRFKKRGRCRDSFRVSTGPMRVGADRHQVTLPRLGTVNTSESTRKLTRRLEAGTGRILSA